MPQARSFAFFAFALSMLGATSIVSAQTPVQLKYTINIIDVRKNKFQIIHLSARSQVGGALPIRTGTWRRTTILTGRFASSLGQWNSRSTAPLAPIAVARHE